MSSEIPVILANARTARTDRPQSTGKTIVVSGPWLGAETTETGARCLTIEILLDTHTHTHGCENGRVDNLHVFGDVKYEIMACYTNAFFIRTLVHW